MADLSFEELCKLPSVIVGGAARSVPTIPVDEFPDFFHVLSWIIESPESYRRYLFNMSMWREMALVEKQDNNGQPYSVWCGVAPGIEPDISVPEAGRRFHSFITNLVMQHFNKINVEFKEIDEYFYGMTQNVWVVFQLLENKHIRYDQAKRMINELFEDQPVGIDINDYLLWSCNWLDEATQDETVVAVRQAIQDNPDAVSDYKGGKEKALGRLIGQVVKTIKCDPKAAREMIIKEINNGIETRQN